MTWALFPPHSIGRPVPKGRTSATFRKAATAYAISEAKYGGTLICQACGSIPRHRIIAWHLGRRPELLRGKKILHFAPERKCQALFPSRGF